MYIVITYKKKITKIISIVSLQKTDDINCYFIGILLIIFKTYTKYHHLSSEMEF